MEKRKKEHGQKPRPIAEVIYGIFRQMLYIVVGIYMLLILVGLPFYNTEGYSHIGTDKAEFFLKSVTYCGGALLPVIALTLLAKVVVLLRNRGLKAWFDLEYYQVADYFQTRFSWTDCFVIFYGISVLLSYICSDYKQEALWGAEYWYMGMITQLTLVVGYFLISRARIAQKWIVLMLLPVSATVFALGYLNRFGIYPIDMIIQNVQFISTIGNINWYCGYLVTVFFGACYVFWQGTFKKPWQVLLLAAYLAIGFATLVTHGSSSGIVTLVVLAFVCFRKSAQKREYMEHFWWGMLLLSLVSLATYLLRRNGVLTITYVEKTTEYLTNSYLPIIMTVVSVVVLLVMFICKKKEIYPQKLFERVTEWICVAVLMLVRLFVLLIVVNTVGNGIVSKLTGMSLDHILLFSPEWGSNRGATWMAGVRCFIEQDILHMLVGVGPDCMAAFLYESGSEGLVEMVKESFGVARLTNAHNEWLTILVNTGLLGVVSFAGIIISAIKRFMKDAEENWITGICGVCLLAYTVNNMFSFQQAMNVTTAFVLLAIGESVVRRKKFERKPVIWLAGDSTMQSYSEESRPQWGWGELLLEKLEAQLEKLTKQEKNVNKSVNQEEKVEKLENQEGKPEKQANKKGTTAEKDLERRDGGIVISHREDTPFAQEKRYVGKYFVVDNCAMAGRSSKTFREEKRLRDIAEHIRKGDYLLVQFGHNDAGKAKPERYVALEDFKDSLKKYVDVARFHGAIPVFLSSIVLCPGPEIEEGDAAEISRLLPDYGEEMQKYAEELGISFIDMNGLTRECLAGKTKEEAESMYQPDHVHLVRKGAEAYAELVAEELSGVINYENIC